MPLAIGAGPRRSMPRAVRRVDQLVRVGPVHIQLGGFGDDLDVSVAAGKVVVDEGGVFGDDAGRPGSRVQSSSIGGLSARRRMPGSSCAARPWRWPVRSVSPRTVTDMAKAMADSAAESHRTARRALPRFFLAPVVTMHLLVSARGARFSPPSGDTRILQSACRRFSRRSADAAEAHRRLKPAPQEQVAQLSVYTFSGRAGCATAR